MNSGSPAADLLIHENRTSGSGTLVIFEDVTERKRTESAGVAVIQDLASDLPPAMADPIQIQQIMINLFNNAIESMGAGCANRSITLATRRVQAATIEVEVADTGCGIAPENRARLFQPFFTTKADGMGIGLLVCQTIIEEHGGTLKVVSEPGSGTTVTFFLPVAEPRS